MGTGLFSKPDLKVEIDEPIRVAIVGAGIGGASAAYYLRQIFGSRLVLKVFEKELVGGRIRSEDITGERYEVGGSIFLLRNRNMMHFVELLDAKKKLLFDNKLILFNGKDTVFASSSWTFVQFMQLIWRYGKDLVKVRKDSHDMLNKFDRIYDHHSNGYCFTTPEKLLASMDSSFVDMTRVSLAEHLQSANYRSRFINELAYGSMKNNYNQSCFDVHAFVGSVSLAGSVGGLLSVAGGNELIPRGILNLALPNEEPVKAEVVSIKRLSANPSKFLLRYDSSSGRSEEEFDFVVLACPQHQESRLQLENMPSVDLLRHEYQPVASTCVRGNIKYEALNTQNESQETKCSVVLSYPPSSDRTYPFNFIGTIGPVLSQNTNIVESLFAGSNKGTPVCKIFSDYKTQPDPEKVLAAEYFEDVEETKVTKWLAYPKYSCGIKLGTFTPVNGFVYLNSIELAASAMEMSTISGRNAALLIRAWVTNSRENIDPCTV